MLHPFVSAAVTGRIQPSMIISAALHATVLFFVVTPTQHVRYTERPRAAFEQVQFAVAFVGNAPVRATRAKPKRHPRTETSSEPHPHTVLADFHEDMPVVMAPAVNEGEHNGTNDLDAIALHPVPKPAKELVFASLAFDMHDVDIQAEPLPTNPKPKYPPSMQRRQVQARFALYFVIDTSGHIDLTSIELPAVSHDEFIHEVLAVLPEWTFEPAIVAGHRVRERVLQPFNFQLK